MDPNKTAFLSTIKEGVVDGKGDQIERPNSTLMGTLTWDHSTQVCVLYYITVHSIDKYYKNLSFRYKRDKNIKPSQLQAKEYRRKRITRHQSLLRYI